MSSETMKGFVLTTAVCSCLVVFCLFNSGQSAHLEAEIDTLKATVVALGQTDAGIIESMKQGKEIQLQHVQLSNRQAEVTNKGLKLLYDTVFGKEE